jgi:hypothetical protein
MCWHAKDGFTDQLLEYQGTLQILLKLTNSGSPNRFSASGNVHFIHARSSDKCTFKDDKHAANTGIMNHLSAIHPQDVLMTLIRNTSSSDQQLIAA